MPEICIRPRACHILFRLLTAKYAHLCHHADRRLWFCYIVIVQSLYFLNPKFQAFSHLLWLYSTVCVGPDQKLQRQDFSSYRRPIPVCSQQSLPPACSASPHWEQILSVLDDSCCSTENTHILNFLKPPIFICQKFKGE